MVMDDPLDFENEDAPLPTPRPSKRKKVIGLDDLIMEYCHAAKDELKAAEKKKKHCPKAYNSDDEDNRTRENEISFCKFVENCEEQVNEMDARDDVPEWGQKVFGCQKSPTSLGDTSVENCELLQTLSGNELLVFDLETLQGESFLEGMLMDGWLSKLVLIYGSVEDSIASWTLNKLLYSSNEKLWVSACDFWNSVLLNLNEADKPLVSLGCFPSYSVLKDALLCYGYLYYTPSSKACTSEGAVTDSLDEGPPQNIIAWLRVVSACCKFRKVSSIFSPSEAEELLVIVISLFLDRRLEGLLLLLSECLDSLVSYFNASEWESSSVVVAESIAQRVNMDLNCLRIVECITGTNNRSRFLRSQLALQFLKICFGLKVANVEKILKSVISINVKAKECSFFKLYVYLILVDNLFFSSDAFIDKPAIIDLWCNYLRNCSNQIGCTDWRFYASKVRNKAAYLLQSVILKRSR